MDEAWKRAVEAAVEGEADPRALTLDGAVKCLGGRLPPSGLLERFQSLEHLSIANVGVAFLDQFPRLPRLQRLSLSDNRIAGGLDHLVAAGLESLRDLDLSNNRIQTLADLAPLARLRLVSLDLYECPVTRIKDYRSKVFTLIRSLKYLDKMDADENERPETDDEEDDEEDDEDEEEDDDPGSGEVEGEDFHGKKVVGSIHGAAADVNGSTAAVMVPVDLDEDEDSDADDDGRVEANGSVANGFRVAPAGEDVDEDDEDDEEVDDEDVDDDDLGEEIDEEEGEDDDVVEVHDIEDSDEDDGVEGKEEVDGEEDDDESEEYVEDGGGAGFLGRVMGADGEIDGHEQGEGDEDDNGELGEEDEHGVENDRDLEEEEEDDDDDGVGVGGGNDEEEDLGTEYLVQPIMQPEEDDEGSDFDAGEDDGEEDGVDDEDDNRSTSVGAGQPSSSPSNKRKRDDDGGVDDSVEGSRPSNQL